MKHLLAIFYVNGIHFLEQHAHPPGQGPLMTQHEAFLEHLRAHPEDDVTRLVYADWLDEQDDPRGRYLRLELELARLRGRGPDCAALEAELKVLLEGLAADWLAAAGKRWDVCLRSYPPEDLVFSVKVVRSLMASPVVMGNLLEAVIRTRAVPVLVRCDALRDEAERARQTFAGRAVELLPAGLGRRYELHMYHRRGGALDHVEAVRAVTGWTCPDTHTDWSVTLKVFPSAAEAELARQQVEQMGRFFVVVRPGDVKQG
jgi:uncharacterized protein (TIGR02996 family)